VRDAIAPDINAAQIGRRTLRASRRANEKDRKDQLLSHFRHRINGIDLVSTAPATLKDPVKTTVFPRRLKRRA
jgi:hypothetical protein